MSCSDNLNPSSIDFVAFGPNNSNIGQYKTLLEITLPSNASRSILEVSLYDKTSNIYDFYSVNLPLEDDCTCIPNCVIKTKLYNSKLYYMFNFNSLIKGYEYRLNFCLKYNKDPIVTIIS